MAVVRKNGEKNRARKSNMTRVVASWYCKVPGPNIYFDKATWDREKQQRRQNGRVKNQLQDAERLLKRLATKCPAALVAKEAAKSSGPERDRVNRAL